MDTHEFKQQFRSPRVRRAAYAIGAVGGAVLMFWAGTEVGTIRAGFNYHRGDNFYRAFGPDAHMGMMAAPAAHGAVGKIVSLTLPTFLVADRDNTEKTVRIENETVIREQRGDIQAADLKAGDFVVVIGEPDTDAEVEARLIRVLPEIPAATSTAPATTH